MSAVVTKRVSGENTDASSARLRQQDSNACGTLSRESVLGAISRQKAVVPRINVSATNSGHVTTALCSRGFTTRCLPP